MNKVKVVYSQIALKELKGLDLSIAKKIVAKVEILARPVPLQKAKALTGQWKGIHRYRVGDYRILFVLTSEETLEIVQVVSVGHRKDIYRK